uniref:Odorant receptor n=1 Tax=Trichogramma kaykai TaxID=54128 RepID=A0ABD2W1U2_9HYME
MLAKLMVQMWLANSEDVQKIMLKLAKKAYFFINFQATSVVIPTFLNLVLPGNQTYKKTLPLHTEFFVNEDEYFYNILTGHLVCLFLYGAMTGAMNNLQCAVIGYSICVIRGLQYYLKDINIKYSRMILIDEEHANLWVYDQLKKVISLHQTLIE